MANLRKIAAVSALGFSRCGRRFPHEGVIVSANEFTDAEWTRLMEEPNLRISAANREETEADQARKAQIAEVIESLAPQHFNKDGTPTVSVLNEMLGEDLGEISKAEVSVVFAELLDGGFKKPEAT